MLERRLLKYFPWVEQFGHPRWRVRSEHEYGFPPKEVSENIPGYDDLGRLYRSQTKKIHHDALSVTDKSLDEWVENSVLVNREELYGWIDRESGVIFATPHYGPYLSAALMFASIGSSERPSNIFYDSSDAVPENARFDKLFRRFGGKLKVLHNNAKGLKDSVKALRKNQNVSIMFDVVQKPSECMFVPFFGKLYPAMKGTAYLSFLTGSPVVPSYSIPKNKHCSQVIFGSPLLPEDYVFKDKSQAIFAMTCELFSSFEKQLRKMPWHWIYWDNVARAREYDDSIYNSEESLRHELRCRIRAYPQLLRKAPALQELFDGS